MPSRTPNATTDSGAPLGRAMAPRSVAVLGASTDPSKWGHILLANVLSGGFQGTVHAVNPRAEKVLGIATYPDLQSLPEVPDLAVVAVPTGQLLTVVQECVRLGVGGALIVTGGLAETGADGRRLQDEIVSTAQRGGLVLIGPNTNGIQNPSLDLRCTLAAMRPKVGHIAIVSQSGNVAQALTVGLGLRGLGLSYYISSGNEADQGLVDYLGFLRDDDTTRVVLAYAEGIRDGRRLYETALEMRGRTPVVLLKSGVSRAGAAAAASHTAVLASRDRVVSAMCRQAGIARVHSIERMVDVAVALATQPQASRPRVAVLTAAGGYGVLAADAFERAGLELAKLSEATLQALDDYLPPRWPRSNPVDKSGKVGPGTDAAMVQILLGDPEVDGVLALGVPIGLRGRSVDQRVADLEEFLTEVQAAANAVGKPVLTLPTWSLLMPEAAERMRSVTPTTGAAWFPTLDGVVDAFAALVASE